MKSEKTNNKVDKKFWATISIPTITFLLTSIITFYDLKSDFLLQDLKIQYIQRDVGEIKDYLKKNKNYTKRGINVIDEFFEKNIWATKEEGKEKIN